MASKEIIIPEGGKQSLPRGVALSELAETNARIHQRILRLRNVASSRGCPVARQHVVEFSTSMEVLVDGDQDEFVYLNDDFLRSLALQAEQHLCPNNPILQGLFDRRAELMAAIVR